MGSVLYRFQIPVFDARAFVLWYENTDHMHDEYQKTLLSSWWLLPVIISFFCENNSIRYKVELSWFMESFLFGPYCYAPCGLWRPSNLNRNLKRHKKVIKISFVINIRYTFGKVYFESHKLHTLYTTLLPASNRPYSCHSHLELKPGLSGRVLTLQAPKHILQKCATKAPIAPSHPRIAFIPKWPQHELNLYWSSYIWCMVGAQNIPFRIYLFLCPSTQGYATGTSTQQNWTRIKKFEAAKAIAHF